MRTFLKIAFVTLLWTSGACAQSIVWPGQSGNAAGYAAAPGWPGSFTATACPSSPASGINWATATVISNCTYSTSSHTQVTCNFCIFEYVDFKSTNTADNNVFATSQNVMFIGCRFQSNYRQGANVSADNSNQYYFYNTFEPLISLYTSPPGFVQWPGAGAGANSTTMTSGVNSVAVNNAYTMGIYLNPTFSNFVVDHNEFWGYGDAIQIGSSTSNEIITSNYMHDTAYPTGVIGGDYHTDGIGYLNGNVGPANVTIIGNAAGMLGNTNAIALQATVGGAMNAITVNENFWSGDNATVTFCRSPGCTNSTYYGNVFGTDVEDFGAVDAGNTIGSGSVWACNTIEFLPGTAWTTPGKGPGNNDGWNPTSGMNGQFFLNTTFPNSVTDQGGNTHCAITTPAAYNFGMQSVGTSSPTQTVTLFNTNTGSLSISSVALVSGAQFVVVSNGCGSTLTSGSNCAIAVKFAPTAQGPQTDTLQITDNSPGVSSPQVVPLLGVATAAPPAGSQMNTGTTLRSGSVVK